MIKKYTKNSSGFKKEPTNETIQFILDFSKSLRIVKTKATNFVEFNLN